MMKLKYFTLGILIVAVVGIIFISVYIQRVPEEKLGEGLPTEVLVVQEKAGILEQDETWSGQILVTDTVDVPAGITLTIEPGTIVKFKHWRYGYTNPEHRLAIEVVGGSINAVGTADKPITFTSDAPDPLHGDWGGVNLRDGATGNFVYTIFEFWNIGAFDSEINFSHSIARWSWGAGIFIKRSDATLTYNRFYENGHNNVEIEDYSKVIIKYNEIANAVQGGIAILDGSEASIKHNVITGNIDNGIVLENNAQANISYNTIKANQASGIAVGPFSSAVITYNTISENKLNSYGPGSSLIVNYNNILDGVQIGPVTDVDLTSNWWGAAQGILPKLDTEVTVDSSGEPITSELSFDFESEKNYTKIPGSANDTYPYVLPDDRTRKIVHRCYEAWNPNGVTWDGKNLWISDEQNIIQMDTKCQILRSFEVPVAWPYDITWGGEGIWVTGYTESIIYKFNTDGELLLSFRSPIEKPAGLTWDGENLWVSEGYGERIAKVSSSGHLLQVFDNMGAQFWGLAWDGQFLWGSSMGDYRIHKIEPATGKAIGWMTASGDRTMGCAWSDEGGEKFLWCADWTRESAFEEKLFKMKMLSIVKE